MKVKTTFLYTLAFLIISSPSILNTFAQAAAYTQLSLPEGAKARFGKGSVEAITYSPDGALLAVGTNIGIWLYDAETFQELALLPGRMDWVSSLAFSPDGKILASGGADMDCAVRLWDVETGAVKATLTGHLSWVKNLSFSPDGSTLASGSLDSTVRLWDVETGSRKAILKGHTSGVGSLLFSPDGKTLASGGWSYDDTVCL